MWSDLMNDFRYALRGLRQTPAFAATVIATLSLGIGANSAIFSAIDAVLLRDAEVADPDSLVDIYTTSGANPYSNSSYPDYFDLRDSGTFASLAAYTPVSITIDANGRPEPLAGQLVSGNYFDVLGITLPLGRGFTADEDRLGAPVHAAVLSNDLWRRTFNADRSLLGQTVRLNSRPYTVVGVARLDSPAPSSAWRPTSGCQRRFSPKWIRRPPQCGARAVIQRSSTCDVRED